MSKRIFAAALTALTLSAVPALASPLCLKHHQSFALNTDTVTLTMMMKPGSDCIQGLRRSYMQIYMVRVIDAPKRGKLAIVGSGFRYMADDNSESTSDQFTIAIDGKNRNSPGMSIVKVVINGAEDEAAGSSQSLASSEPSPSVSALPILL